VDAGPTWGDILFMAETFHGKPGDGRNDPEHQPTLEISDIDFRARPLGGRSTVRARLELPERETTRALEACFGRREASREGLRDKDAVKDCCSVVSRQGLKNQADTRASHPSFSAWEIMDRPDISMAVLTSESSESLPP